MSGTRFTYIIAIDPGNDTGLVCGMHDQTPTVTNLKLTPKKSTKNTPAEPEHLRYSKLFNEIQNRITLAKNQDTRVIVVCEDAAAFSRGKAAVQVSHSYRGVCKAVAGVNGCDFYNVQPMDLKFSATGKRTSEKTEMIEAANKKGYVGHNDDEADAYLLWFWAKENKVWF